MTITSVYQKRCAAVYTLLEGISTHVKRTLHKVQDLADAQFLREEVGFNCLEHVVCYAVRAQVIHRVKEQAALVEASVVVINGVVDVVR